MKYFLLLLISFILFFSCKKEEACTFDENVTYSHFYQLKSHSQDTLFAVYIPNAFSPNGDGRNDVFFPRFYGDHSGFNIQIVDKLGTIVYESNDVNFYWNGEYQGALNQKQLSSYTYKFKIKDQFGVEFEYAGGFMLYH